MKITIPAAASNGTPGAISLNFSTAGFSIQQSTGTFTLQFGSRDPQTVAVGQSIGAAKGPALGVVQFSNATSTAIQVTLGEYGVNQVTVTQAGAETFVSGNSLQYDIGVPGGGGAIQLPGIDAQGRHRKVIYISNPGVAAIGNSSNAVIVVTTQGSGFTMAIIPPGPPVAIETDANLQVACLTATLGSVPSHCQVAILELFYTGSLQTNQ